jgi:acyl-CoA thioester hydrolase
MRPPIITSEQLAELGRPCYRFLIPKMWADRNGHMNMRYYVALFDDAGDEMHVALGLTPAFHKARNTGTFDLEHHTHFLREVKTGDGVAVYARPVGRSAKRVHYVMFLVNEANEELAAIFECVGSFVDLATRRTAPFPEEVAAAIDRWIAQYSRLTWPAPVCGVMSAGAP